MDRREHLRRLTASAVACLSAARAQGPAEATGVEGLLQAGGCVVMLRHAQTVPGIGDPPGFELDQCRTQRNLSDAGRAQAQRLGEWFRNRRLTPRNVESSPWCRCKDTADLAFGRHRVLPALASTFNGDGSPANQTQALRTLLAALPGGQFDVWVTHQVNITALTGEATSMGEALILGRDGKPMGRSLFT